MKNWNRGYTLIEVLIVMVIISTLAVLAIPQFMAYRKRGFNAHVQTDTRNAATAQEAYFVYEGKYYSGDCRGLPGFTLSDNLVVCRTYATRDGFMIDVTHPNASISCKWFTPANSKGERISCS